MKHLLNNLSEEEKNSIREQHTGGMKVVTENFNRLLNSKLGDSKPLVNEQTAKPTIGGATTSKNTPTKGGTPTSKNTPTKGGTSTTTFIGKTVNLYTDDKNVTPYATGIKIVDFKSDNNKPVFKFDKFPNTTFLFVCDSGAFLDIGPTKSGQFYNNNLSKTLKMEYCTKSSGGTNVPKADYAANTPTSDSATA